MPNILLYLTIILVKTFEISISTVRIKLITKGQKLAGAVIGFFEVCIWLIVVSLVLQDITDDPLKVVAYSLGFALGNYFGSILEEKIALGSSRMDVIVKEDVGLELARILRDKNYAVTVIDGKGRQYDRKILLIVAKRKDMKTIHAIINETTDNAFITTSDITPVIGGYGIRR